MPQGSGLPVAGHGSPIFGSEIATGHRQHGRRRCGRAAHRCGLGGRKWIYRLDSVGEIPLLRRPALPPSPAGEQEEDRKQNLRLVNRLKMRMIEDENFKSEWIDFFKINYNFYYFFKKIKLKKIQLN